jgi:hypothetical protein
MERENGGSGAPAANPMAMEEFTHCAVCDRTPLVGEGMIVLEKGRREAAVCSLCLAKPRAAALGEPIREERVRTAVGAATVHRVIPTPVPAREPVKA